MGRICDRNSERSSDTLTAFSRVSWLYSVGDAIGRHLRRWGAGWSNWTSRRGWRNSWRGGVLLRWQSVLETCVFERLKADEAAHGRPCAKVAPMDDDDDYGKWIIKVLKDAGAYPATSDYTDPAMARWNSTFRRVVDSGGEVTDGLGEATAEIASSHSAALFIICRLLHEYAGSNGVSYQRALGFVEDMSNEG